MEKRKYLVTGGAGFIGSHLVDHLLEQGHTVFVVDNFNDSYSPAIKRENIKEHLKHPSYKLFEGNLCDYGFVKSIYDEAASEGIGFTHIVHLAALAGVRPSVADPVLYQNNNNESTMNLLDLTVKAKEQNPSIKMVFASSSSVYGARNQVPFRESEDITKPISPYASTKVCGEAMCHTISHLHDLPIVALRFFTVYGPRQRPDLAIHKFTKLIDEGKEIPVYGDGSAQRDFTYIDDIIDGVLKSIDYDFKKTIENRDPESLSKAKFEIFNLGESQTTDVNTMIALIEESLGKKAKIKQMDPIPGDVPITYAEVSKAKEYISYNPQTKIKDGIPKFIQWYESTKKALV